MVFFFKQKTAYEMCERDWSSDVCSSDLPLVLPSSCSLSLIPSLLLSLHSVSTPSSLHAVWLTDTVPFQFSGDEHVYNVDKLANGHPPVMETKLQRSSSVPAVRSEPSYIYISLWRISHCPADGVLLYCLLWRIKDERFFSRARDAQLYEESCTGLQPLQ